MSIWFKHDAHFHEHPKSLKMRRLAGARADSSEVGWWRIVAAAKRVGQWTFEDEDHLKDASGRYYNFVRIYREVGLLDGLTIHNGAEYQAPMSGAERVRRHRSNADNVTSGVTDVTPREEESRAERVEQTPRDPADIYWQLTGRFPKDKALSWIDSLTATYGAEPTIRAIVKAQAVNQNVSDLLSRSQDILRADARKLDVKEREAETQRLAEKRAVPRVEEPWRAEYRRAIQKQYADLEEAS